MNPHNVHGVLEARRLSSFSLTRLAGAAAAFSLASLAVAGGFCPLPMGLDFLPFAPPAGIPFATESINDDGIVIGYLNGANEKPAIWSAEGGVQQVPMPPGGLYGFGVGMSADGSIAMTIIKAAIGDRAFVRFPDGTYHEILPISPSGQSFARAMHMDGVVVGRQAVGSAGSNNSPYCGFRWSLEEGKTDVIVGPGPNCEVLGINSHGVMVGWTGVTKTTPGASGFILAGDEVTLLPPISGGFCSTAKKINDQGWVVGDGRIFGGPYGVGLTRGFLWCDGEMIVFEPTPGYELSSAVGVTNDGVVLISSWGGIDPGTPAVAASLWCNGERIDLVPPWVKAPVLAIGSRAINNAGQLSVAVQHQPSQLNFSARADPIPFPKPSPDLTADGIVDGADLQVFLGMWGAASSSPADLNQDGAVDAADLGLLLAGWGSAR